MMHRLYLQEDLSDVMMLETVVELYSYPCIFNKNTDFASCDAFVAIQLNIRCFNVI